MFYTAMHITIHSTDKLMKYNTNIDYTTKMSKTASPTSVVTSEVIQQAHGRRVDCELNFDQLKQ